MPTYTHTLHECARYDVVAIVDYHIEPASGDGWHEPRLMAEVIIDGATLIKEWHKRTGFAAEPIGDALPWMLEVLQEDEALIDALMDEACDDEPDADDMPGGRNHSYSPDL